MGKKQSRPKSAEFEKMSFSVLGYVLKVKKSPHARKKGQKLFFVVVTLLPKNWVPYFLMPFSLPFDFFISKTVIRAERAHTFNVGYQLPALKNHTKTELHRPSGSPGWTWFLPHISFDFFPVLTIPEIFVYHLHFKSLNFDHWLRRYGKKTYFFHPSAQGGLPNQCLISFLLCNGFFQVMIHFLGNFCLVQMCYRNFQKTLFFWNIGFFVKKFSASLEKI